MAAPTIAPPTSQQGRKELRALREPFRLVASLPGLVRRADQAGRVVVTVPGFKADDRSMAPLRAFLRWSGHRPEGWGLGVNTGAVEALWPALVERVATVAARAGTTVDLVGWSLGGVLAREVARDLPDRVGSVVTFGTPVVGGPRFTRAAGIYSQARLDAIEDLIDQREQVPIDVPITAIYSKNDGIVAWRACIDPFDNDVEHVEVSSAHFGMVLDPDVWRVVGRAVGGAGQRDGAELRAG